MAYLYLIKQHSGEWWDDDSQRLVVEPPLNYRLLVDPLVVELFERALSSNKLAFGPNRVYTAPDAVLPGMTRVNLVEEDYPFTGHNVYKASKPYWVAYSADGLVRTVPDTPFLVVRLIDWEPVVPLPQW